jgi:hypothetical protein
MNNVEIYDLRNNVLNGFNLSHHYELTSTSDVELFNMANNVIDFFPDDLLHSNVKPPTIYLNVGGVSLPDLPHIAPNKDFGFYHIKHNIIVICTKYSEYDDILVHELGHFLLCEIDNSYSRNYTYNSSIHEGFSDILTIMYEANKLGMDLTIPLADEIVLDQDSELWNLGNDKFIIRKILSPDRHRNFEEIYYNGALLTNVFVNNSKKYGLSYTFDMLVDILLNDKLNTIDNLITYFNNYNSQVNTSVVGLKDPKYDINIIYIGIFSLMVAFFAFG